jgi:hypothetical protein
MFARLKLSKLLFSTVFFFTNCFFHVNCFSRAGVHETNNNLFDNVVAETTCFNHMSQTRDLNASQLHPINLMLI